MRAPAIEWPSNFQESGPTGDPSILLIGGAKIANTDYVVTAIRMKEGLRDPDFHDDIERQEYEAILDKIFNNIEMLTDLGEPSLLTLEGGRYMLWMVPTDLN